jgi:hypothetical protein
MAPDWTVLAASGGDYNAGPMDCHYGATAPLEPLPCRCERPGFAFDDDEDEERCWKCGARPAEPAACRP